MDLFTITPKLLKNYSKITQKLLKNYFKMFMSCPPPPPPPLNTGKTAK